MPARYGHRILANQSAAVSVCSAFEEASWFLVTGTFRKPFEHVACLVANTEPQSIIGKSFLKLPYPLGLNRSIPVVLQLVGHGSFPWFLFARDRQADIG